MKFADKYVFESSAHVWKPVWIEEGEEKTLDYPVSSDLKELQSYMELYADSWELFYDDTGTGSFLRWSYGYNTPEQEYFRKIWPTIEVGC